MRVILLFVKHYIFDFLRQFVNLYNLFLFFPPKKFILEFFGAQIHKTARILGRISVYEPGWIQLNHEAKITNLNITGPYILLVEKGAQMKNLKVKNDSIILKNEVLFGCELEEKRVTFSIDLEGGVGLSHTDKKNWQKFSSKWESRDIAYRLAKLIEKYQIPTTWAVCGHLFLEACNGQHSFQEMDWYGDWFKYDPASNKYKDKSWYMPDLIAYLKQKDIFEIAYHSFAHFNYLKADYKNILTDLEWAKAARNNYNLKLNTFVFPYNAVACLKDVVDAGFYNLRGYIGRYYLPKTLDFGNFRFFGTSQYIGPQTIKYCVKNINKIINKNFNYFTHPEDWNERELNLLEIFLFKLSEINKSKKIKVYNLNQ